MTDDSPLRVAIIGAGPSGFYAAGQLLAVAEPQFAVDLYDRLPTPYGLVRSGVAPDHPKIKSVTRAYDKTTEHERFRFFGHVELGGDISRAQLLEHYHVVLYTLGTSIDKRLGIPGEDLRGSHAATEFVAWYNGHPDHCGLEVDLQAKQAVVVGAGNVAIDVARMLALAPPSWRSPTPPITRWRCCGRAESRRSPSSRAGALCRPRGPIPSCSRWASSSAATSM